MTTYLRTSSSPTSEEEMWIESTGFPALVTPKSTMGNVVFQNEEFSHRPAWPAATLPAVCSCGHTQGPEWGNASFLAPCLLSAQQ